MNEENGERQSWKQNKTKKNKKNKKEHKMSSEWMQVDKIYLKVLESRYYVM